MGSSCTCAIYFSSKLCFSASLKRKVCTRYFRKKKEMLFRQIYINALMGKNFSSKASCDAFLLYQQKCKKYFLYWHFDGKKLDYFFHYHLFLLIMHQKVDKILFVHFTLLRKFQGKLTSTFGLSMQLQVWLS